MEKRERVRRDRKRREGEQKEIEQKENWRESGRRDSERRDSEPRDEQRNDARRDDNSRGNDFRDDNSRDNERRGGNRRDNDRRDGNRRNDNFRQDDGPRKSGRDNPRINRPKSYRPPPPTEKKNIDYTAIPDPHMFDNLKRETDEIAALTAKKYGKRQVFSNWAKYEEPPAARYFEEAYEDESRGADFEELLQGAQIGGHMKLKCESDWDNRSAALQNEIFSLNVGNLSLGLACIPFYEKMELPREMFTSSDIERMDSYAKLNATAYEMTRKNHIKPRIKRQEPSKASAENELSLYNNTEAVQTKQDPSATLTFDIPEPEPEDKIDFGIPAVSAKDNLKKPHSRMSPDKTVSRSHQTPPPESRNSPLRTLESKTPEIQGLARTRQDSHKSMNGHQSPDRYGTSPSRSEMMLANEREANVNQRHVTNSFDEEQNVDKVQQRSAERAEKDMPENRWSAEREGSTDSWRSEREGTARGWSSEKETGGDRWSAERDVATERYSAEKEIVRERQNSEKDIGGNRRSTGRDGAAERYSAEKDIVDKRRNSEKELGGDRCSSERDVVTERYCVEKERSSEREVVSNLRSSAENEIPVKNQGADIVLTDTRQSVEKDIPVVSKESIEAVHPPAETPDKEATVKKRRANRNRGNKGKRKSAEFQGDDHQTVKNNEASDDGRPKVNPDSYTNQENSYLEERDKAIQGDNYTAKPEIDVHELSARKDFTPEPQVPTRNVEKHHTLEPEIVTSKHAQKHPTPEPEMPAKNSQKHHEPDRNLNREKSATPEVGREMPQNLPKVHPSEQRNKKVEAKTKDRFAEQELVRNRNDSESHSERARSIETETNRKSRKSHSPEPKPPVVAKQKSPEVEVAKNRRPEAEVVKSTPTKQVNMSNTFSVAKEPVAQKPVPVKPPQKTRTPKKPGQEDDQLDFLLSLRKPSYDTPVSFAKSSKAVRSTIDDDDETPKVVGAAKEKTAENLEDWLDSMLDD